MQVRFVISAGLALVFGEIFGTQSAPTAASVSERIAILSYVIASVIASDCEPRAI